MATSLHGDYRVLVLAPFGKDAMLVREVLERSGIPVGVVGDVAAIARCVSGGAGARHCRRGIARRRKHRIVGPQRERPAYVVGFPDHRSYRRRCDHALIQK